MRYSVFYSLLILALLIFNISTGAETDGTSIAESQPEPDQLSNNLPGIFITGPEVDQDFLRRELTFVGFVRDPKQADIYILISRQTTGAGGKEFTVEFIGQNSYAAKSDTLTYVCLESDSEDDRRNEMLHVLKMGLVRYIAQTPLAEFLNISYSQPTSPAPVTDAWNNWWFTIRGDSWLHGEKSYRNINAWGSISAQRVTEEMKIKFSTFGSYNESKYDYDYYKALSISRGKGANASVYFSLDDHWSAGLATSVNASEYRNINYALEFKPGIEYNIFPYDESSRRRLSFTYQVAGRYADYEEETIYDKMNEMLYYQSLRITLELIQPWGSIKTSITGNQYLHDLEKNWLGIRTSLSWRIFQGLSFELSGGYSRIHDQLSLRKGEATEEEILLRRQEMQTSYDYWSSFGISYSFGSRFNSIVNPRF